MEDWKKNLGELLNAHRYFPYDEWNKQIDALSQEWVGELNRRTGVRANFELTSDGKKVAISFNAEPEFIVYVKYVSVGEGNEICLKVKYSVKHFPLRKFRAMIKGEDDNSNEEKDYQWMEEMLTLEDGPLLEKGFVLQTLNIALRRWLERKD